jgi:hypothetical protein
MALPIPTPSSQAYTTPEACERFHQALIFLEHFGVTVSRTRVVVLAAPSLFTEGIAARLGQHADRIDLSIVDSRDTDAVARSIAARPAVVLLEAQDENVEGPCSLMDLMAAVPDIKLIRLDPSHDQVQVVISEQVTVREPMDLISLVLSPA